MLYITVTAKEESDNLFFGPDIPPTHTSILSAFDAAGARIGRGQWIGLASFAPTAQGFIEVTRTWRVSDDEQTEIDIPVSDYAFSLAREVQLALRASAKRLVGNPPREPTIPRTFWATSSTTRNVAPVTPVVARGTPVVVEATPDDVPVTTTVTEPATGDRVQTTTTPIVRTRTARRTTVRTSAATGQATTTTVVVPFVKAQSLVGIQPSSSQTPQILLVVGGVVLVAVAYWYSTKRKGSRRGR